MPLFGPPNGSCAEAFYGGCLYRTGLTCKRTCVGAQSFKVQNSLGFIGMLLHYVADMIVFVSYRVFAMRVLGRFTLWLRAPWFMVLKR